MYPSLGTGMVSVSGDRSPSSQSTVPGSNTTTHSLLQRRDSGNADVDFQSFFYYMKIFYIYTVQLLRIVFEKAWSCLFIS